MSGVWEQGTESVKIPPPSLRHLLILLLVTAGLGIPAALLPLSGDEAYYWDCGWHPDWASYDQPPLVLWLVRAFTQLFGHSALTVRMPSLLFTFLTGLLLVFWLGKEGLWTFLLLRCTPLFFFGSFYLSTDLAMSFFYLLATFLFVRIRGRSTLGRWLALGACLGLGFLAKFPIILVVVLFFFLPWKGLRLPHVLAGAATAALLTVPVWIYALRHDWSNIVFQLFTRHNAGTSAWSNLAQFWGPHLVLLGPILFPLGMWKAWSARREDRLLWISGCVPWVFFGLGALRSFMAPSWGVPGVQSWAILTRTAWTRRTLKWTLIPSTLVTAVLLFLVCFPGFLVGVAPGVARNLIGLDRLAQVADRELQPEEIMVSSSYNLAATLNFRLKKPGAVRLARVHYGKHGLSYLYLQEREDFKGKNLLFITSKEDELKFMRPYVEAETTLIRLPIWANGRIIKTYLLAHLRGVTDDSVFKP
jgi:4-amino-4-deoxy-L-arabinose transferase-like glycosyltransferase